MKRVSTQINFVFTNSLKPLCAQATVWFGGPTVLFWGWETATFKHWPWLFFISVADGLRTRKFSVVIRCGSLQPEVVKSEETYGSCVIWSTNRTQPLTRKIEELFGGLGRPPESAGSAPCGPVDAFLVCAQQTPLIREDQDQMEGNVASAVNNEGLRVHRNALKSLFFL